MKDMMRKTIAIILALVLVLALPITASAAGKKGKTVRIKGVTAYLGSSSAGLQFSWDKVSGADGYQYCYNLNWKENSKAKDYKVKTTSKTSVKFKLSNFNTVDFKVRAYAMVKGERIYGGWSSYRLTRNDVDELVLKQVRKVMKSKELFIRMNSKNVNIRSGAGDNNNVVAQYSRGDEARATGNFKRDSKGVPWIEIYVSLDQNTVTKGWVSSKVTSPVWY